MSLKGDFIFSIKVNITIRNSGNIETEIKMDANKNGNISIQAKIVRQLINIATSDHLIGPGIKKGKIGRAHV